MPLSLMVRTARLTEFACCLGANVTLISHALPGATDRQLSRTENAARLQ